MTEKTPPHPPIVRPGADPTHNDEQGGKRWHYLNLDGSKMDPCSFVYEHVSGGFGGECGHYIFPDGYSPAGPATMDHIRERIEAKLIELGSEVIDPPEWWAEAQTIRAALPDGFRLNGPAPLGMWRVVEGPTVIGPGHATPTAALRYKIGGWTLPLSGSRPGDIQAVKIVEPAPMSFSVTLPDGTRIDVNMPAR